MAVNGFQLPGLKFISPSPQGLVGFQRQGMDMRKKGGLSVEPTFVDTLNPLDFHPDFTLSNGNLRATKTANNAVRSGRGVRTRTTGRWYLETSLITTTGGTIATGVGNAGASLLNGAGETVDSIGAYADGRLLVNGSTLAHEGDARGNSGDWAQLCLDLTARLWWFRAPTVNGNWNNSGTAVPGVSGGLPFSSGIGAGVPVFIMVSAQSTAAPDAVQVNLGATAFTYGIPSALFRPWNG